MESQIVARAQAWIDNPYIDEASRNAVKKLMESSDPADKKELEDSFYRNLEFGTGGLRGIMGPGNNRMNRYTVGMATQGLANYLKKVYGSEPISVAIAHDSRNNSRAFAQVTADVFSANGIKVYFFEALRPTPELSFAIRYLGCKSGVVLTASHNPKEYNGYKAYWADGAQMIAPHDKNTISEVEAITGPQMVKWVADVHHIVSIGREIDEAYLERAKALSISPEAIHRQKDLKIVYTPLHGTGITLVPELLKMYGFERVYIVERQAVPDGNFPTVVYPNPEEAEALTIALEEAKQLDADLVLATDPDTDRVGIAAKNLEGEWQLLNGNQTATLLFYYMLNARKEAGTLTSKQYIVKTIVTTDILDGMAQSFGVPCYSTLTGFKYIAGIIREKEGKEEFVVGGEESYGYLPGDFVRDKDAVASCALIAEMTAWAKDNGMSVFKLLADIYQQFGFYYEGLVSLTKKGKDGAEEIKAMMADWRATPPTKILGEEITEVLDYKNLTRKTASGIEPMEFEKSDVLQFITASGTKISARPSGTEPKIKFYISVNAPLDSASAWNSTEAALKSKVAEIIKELKLS